MTADSFNEIDVLMQATREGSTAVNVDLDLTHDFEVDEGTHSSMAQPRFSQAGNLIGNPAAEQHFHSHFQVNSNILGRTKETLENYLVKRIAQLNSNRRAKSTSKTSQMASLMSKADTRNFDSSFQAAYY